MTAENEEIKEPVTDGNKADEQAEDNKNKKQKQLKKEVTELQNKLDKLQKERDELYDKYVAVVAEYSNYRKRSSAEKDDLYSASVASTVTSFLALLDNLERAASYAPDDAGIAALLKQFGEILTKLGVTEMETDGKTFDPNLHNAIMHEEDADKPENTIVTTFAKGYMLGDRVVRHAMVKVVN